MKKGRGSEGRPLVLGLAVVLAAGMGWAAPAEAQQWERRAVECDGGDRDRERMCEIRTATFTSTGSLALSGGINGGIEVSSWDRNEVEVVGRVQAYAESLERAREILGAVELDADRNSIEADGPDGRRREGWGVSWTVRVPRDTDLDLVTTNGGIEIRSVTGDIDVRTTNGGLDLQDVGGEVRGRTTNGPIRVALTGDRWNGAGVDLQTTNGGVSLAVPDSFSGELDLATTNGGIELGFPVTVQGRLGRRLRTTLGDGGPPVRLHTTNGRVSIERR